MTARPLTNEAQRQTILDLINMLNLDMAWTVEIKRKTNKRTLSQNALYWQWINTVCAETGNDQDDVHEAFKDQFCPVKEVELFDEKRLIRSTKKLNTKEMGDYMDRVYAFVVGDLGILLPIPEDQGR